MRNFLLVLLLITCGSWGFLVHRTTQQLSIYQLPASIQPFFYQNMKQLVKNSTRPDERRNTDSTEHPKHFIDIEDYGTNALYDMPLLWEDAVKKYSKDTLKQYGYLPYHIVSMMDDLTKAFKEKDTERILFLAADLGHYIQDAHVPLHTTTNYDGQLTNQKGIHSLWESLVPEVEIQEYQLYSKHKAKYIKDVPTAIWKVIRESNALVKDVLENEINVSKQFVDSTKYTLQIRRGKTVKNYSTAFAKAYGASLKPTINKQLLASANMVADCWYTAWVNAGKPDLSNTLTDDEKNRLLKEKKSFKRNRLIQDGFLIAKSYDKN